MATDQRLHYAIIGGGISGLTLAIALHHRGIAITLYEQALKFGEIGAGVSFTPNAIQAMKLCHHGIYEAFERVCTRNLWPSKQKVWFDYYDGVRDRHAFSITNDLGQNGVHRAQYLDELVKLLPEDVVSFGKKLRHIQENETGKLTLQFEDGSTGIADCVLACDGIKSNVRRVMFGDDHPCAMPSYSHKYAYRALVPMDEAVAAIGKEKAENACMHMGHSNHVLTFPVNRGQILNVVAFHTTNNEWPDSSRLTAPATREDALRDFRGFGSTVISLLQLVRPTMYTWAIFDLGDNPPPAFYKGRICLVGDAAHASSPHHGAGAGLCIEDAALLAALLSNSKVDSHTVAETAFTVYDSLRRDRGAWLVQSSRHIGDTYEWLATGIEDNLAQIEQKINERNGMIANFDVKASCETAENELEKRIVAET